jgi:hypothetical protein
LIAVLNGLRRIGIRVQYRERDVRVDTNFEDRRGYCIEGDDLIIGWQRRASGANSEHQHASYRAQNVAHHCKEYTPI